MRYTLDTRDGKLKKDGTGKNTCYYARGWDGSKGVMSQDWVVSNIDYISNASLSGGRVYLVEDRFDKASRIIQKNMISQMNSSELDIKEAYAASTCERSMSKTTQLPAKATTNEAWNFIAHYGINQCFLEESWVFMTLLRKALKEINKQGKTVWLLQVDSKVTLSTRQVEGAIEVTSITQVLERLD